jgi:hypothetical protein
MPLYNLQHSLHLQKLLSNPVLLSQHQEMDVVGCGVFPVRVPCPALGTFDVCWSDLELLYDGSSVHIESLFQALTTGQAVREYWALLREIGLVPGHVVPRYRQDLVSTDPYRIEAGWLRTLQ